MKALKFDHKAHVEMWDWLAQNPGAAKLCWVKLQKYKCRKLPEYFQDCSYCFACVAALEIKKDAADPGRICDYCPLYWDGRPGFRYTNPCMEKGAAYQAWIHAFSEYVADLKINHGKPTFKSGRVSVTLRVERLDRHGATAAELVWQARRVRDTKLKE